MSGSVAVSDHIIRYNGDEGFLVETDAACRGHAGKRQVHE
jgi:hypothetical protein